MRRKICRKWRAGISGFLVVATLGALLAKEPNSSEGYTRQIQVSPLLSSTKTSSGQPIAYPKTDTPRVTAVLVEIPPGAETGWHQHPYPCYAYILSGELTVEVKGDSPKKLRAGDAFFEVVDTIHNGTNHGTEAVRLVMFVTGEEGKPFTVRVPDAEPGGK